MKKTTLIALAAITLLTACSEPKLKPCGPVPSKAQLDWQRMEINMFCHFGPNTFTGAEWGTGEESNEVFRPTALDCRQWVDVAKQAGMKGIILTAKHHDGFCLWPSAYSDHTVAKDNDVLRAFVEACRKGGLKAGVYISPWDRNHPTYGTQEYNTVFANTLKEVHKKYGPFFEQWFDGACGEGPNGKRQEYNWPLFERTVSKVNKRCVMFSDVGPGCRWVGNEEGYAGETNWSALIVENGQRTTENGGCGNPSNSELRTPNSELKWVPAEVDVSIRPSWFWHPDEHPKTVDELMEIYYNSVGRNGLLLLNVPPDTNGRIDPEDSAVLVAFRQERDRIFSNDLTQGGKFFGTTYRGLPYTISRFKPENMIDHNDNTYWVPYPSKYHYLGFSLEKPQVVDIIVLQEYLPLGQRVAKFHITCRDEDDGGETIDCGEGTTIGYKRIIRLPRPINMSLIHIYFDSVLDIPAINRLALYNSQAQ